MGWFAAIPDYALNDETDLERLIADMEKGDKEALAGFYRQTKTAVYGFALSILKNPHDAEDVLQDVCVRVYESAHLYRPYGKPMAWILTITKNLCYSRLRNPAAPANTPDENESAPDFSGNALIGIWLGEALETLGDAERQIVMLKAVSGMKHREIAAILDIPLPTVLAKYKRSLSKLKLRLTDD